MNSAASLPLLNLKIERMKITVVWENGLGSRRRPVRSGTSANGGFSFTFTLKSSWTSLSSSISAVQKEDEAVTQKEYEDNMRDLLPLFITLSSLRHHLWGEADASHLCHSSSKRSQEEKGSRSSIGRWRRRWDHLPMFFMASVYTEIKPPLSPSQWGAEEVPSHPHPPSTQPLPHLLPQLQRTTMMMSMKYHPFLTAKVMEKTSFPLRLCPTPVPASFPTQQWMLLFLLCLALSPLCTMVWCERHFSNS